MGLKNKSEYTFTNHFIKRFLERVNVEYDSKFNHNVSQVLDSVNLIRENGNRHYYKNDKFFIVADNAKKRLVTIYGINEPEDKVSEEDLNIPLLPNEYKEPLQSLLENYASTFFKDQQKQIKQLMKTMNSKKITSMEDLKELKQDLSYLLETIENTEKLYRRIQRHDLLALGN